jgi:hypothetical protein
MRRAVAYVFGSWKGLAEYLIFLSVTVAGLLGGSLLWIPIGAMLLFLLAWPRSRELIAQAGQVDADFRELGRLALQHRVLDYGLRNFARGVFHVPLVLAGKFGLDGLVLSGAYVVGIAAGWLWGVCPYGGA